MQKKYGSNQSSIIQENKAVIRLRHWQAVHFPGQDLEAWQFKVLALQQAALSPWKPFSLSSVARSSSSVQALCLIAFARSDIQSSLNLSA